MASFSLQGFNHTSFIVADLERALGFFHDLLGFELLSRAPRDPGLIGRMTGLADAEVEIAFLRGAGHTIELIAYHSGAGRRHEVPKVYDTGAAHIALDVDDVEAAVEAGRGHGLELVGEIIVIDNGPNRGRQVVYLQSPYGLTVEFIGPKPPS